LLRPRTHSPASSHRFRVCDVYAVSMHFHVSPLNVYPDALVEVKELLGNSEATQDLKCVDILDQLAAYAESFSRARHKAKKLPSSMSDTLDREGNS
jgi:hypothetical protein